MVNIQAIVYIDNTGTVSFDSFPEYWAFLNRSLNQAEKNRMTKYKQMMVACAIAMSSKYGYSMTETENIVLAFGTIKQTNEGMKIFANRDLLCNLENKVIVEIKETPIGTHIVTTIHRPTGFERIITVCKQTISALRNEP